MAIRRLEGEGSRKIGVSAVFDAVRAFSELSDEAAFIKECEQRGLFLEASVELINLARENVDVALEKSKLQEADGPQVRQAAFASARNTIQCDHRFD